MCACCDRVLLICATCPSTLEYERSKRWEQFHFLFSMFLLRVMWFVSLVSLSVHAAAYMERPFLTWLYHASLDMRLDLSTANMLAGRMSGKRVSNDAWCIWLKTRDGYMQADSDGGGVLIWYWSRLLGAVRKVDLKEISVTIDEFSKFANLTYVIYKPFKFWNLTIYYQWNYFISMC